MLFPYVMVKFVNFLHSGSQILSFVDSRQRMTFYHVKYTLLNEESKYTIQISLQQMVWSLPKTSPTVSWKA